VIRSTFCPYPPVEGIAVAPHDSLKFHPVISSYPIRINKDLHPHILLKWRNFAGLERRGQSD
jgi:hypothetical protein